jgi:hypothetical protein
MKFFDLQNKLGNDACAINAKDYQNASMNDYALWNTYFYHCDNPNENKLINFASDNTNLHYRNGYGFTTACHVGDDTELRVNGKITREKAKNQFFTRFYQANPYLGKGEGNADIESKIVFGDDTSQLRQCHRLGERDYKRFTPLLPCLQDTMQNPNTVIYPWTNGGDNSRILMREANALKKCGYLKKHDKEWARQ